MYGSGIIIHINITHLQSTYQVSVVNNADQSVAPNLTVTTPAALMSLCFGTLRKKDLTETSCPPSHPAAQDESEIMVLSDLHSGKMH